MKKRLKIFSVAAALSMLVFPSVAQSPKGGVNKVVIDAGHGGKDPGTVSKLYREKDINLSVALKLGALINKHYPAMQVVYTRKTDVFIPLDERGRIANKAGADLFISIHVNASPNTAANGADTYVMGSAKSRANLEVAMRENDVITYEQDYSTRYMGYEPGSAESFIIFSLMQYSYLDQSLVLADMIQQQYKKSLPLIDRGVKQAGFLVLWNTAMPSVLTELGFLSNKGDEAFLASTAGQEKCARALFNAFSAYKTKADGRGTLIVLEDDPKPDSTVAEPSADASAAVSTVPDPAPAATSDVAPAATVTPVASAPKGITFAVQVRISSSRIPTGSVVFGEYRGQVTEKKIGNLYKYYVGECDSYTAAVAKQREVRATVKDAFVVAFADGQPANLAEAIKSANSKQ